MSDKIPVNSEEMIDQYLKNELHGEELSNFEIILLEDESLFHEVQIRQQLIESLQDSRINAPPITSLSESRKENIIGGVRRNASFFVWIKQPLSIAASLLVTISVTFSLQDLFQSSQSVTPINDFSSIESRLIFDSLRGDSERVNFSGNPPILITIDLGPVFSGVYNVSIVDSQKDQEIAKLERIELSEPGRINFLLNTKLVGDYEILTSNVNAELVRADSIKFD